jgi:hypothetical protein
LTTATSTSSPLGKLTLFQNSNSTGLNPANSLFIYYLEWFSLLTGTCSLLKIKTNLQYKLHNCLLILLNLHKWRNLWLNLRNWQSNLHNQCYLQSNNNFLRTSNLLPDQVASGLQH